MKIISDIVVYILVGCAVLGGLASVFRPKSKLGEQFMEGINSMGGLFVPIAGIMASIPILTQIISWTIGPVFSFLGADPAMAATTLLAVDMGGYPLAHSLAATNEAWTIATINGYMAGATIVFTIPIALQIIPEKYYRELSLGAMIGFISIPFGILISCLVIYFTNPLIRGDVSTSLDAAQVALNMDIMVVVRNLFPLVLICIIMAYGLMKFPKQMIKGFKVFGQGVDGFAKLIITLSIVQMFTGVFNNFPLDPIIADAISQERALEITGTIALMLCGAFSMVYLLQTYLSKPLEKIGRMLGLSKELTAGVLAASANSIAAFSMIDETMSEIDIISLVAFSICGAFVIGDHLAFTANFQPNLMIPIILGKLAAGFIAIMMVRMAYKYIKVTA